MLASCICNKRVVRVTGWCFTVGRDMAQAPGKGKGKGKHSAKSKGTEQDSNRIILSTYETPQGEIVIYAPEGTKCQLEFGNSDLAEFPAQQWLDEHHGKDDPKLPLPPFMAIGICSMNLDGKFGALPESFPAVLKKEIFKKQMKVQIGGTEILFQDIGSKNVMTYPRWPNKLWNMRIRGTRPNGKQAIGGIFYYFNNLVEYHDPNHSRMTPSELAIFAKEKIEETNDDDFDELLQILGRMGHNGLFDREIETSLKSIIEDLTTKEKADLYMKLANVDCYKYVFTDFLCSTFGADMGLVWQATAHAKKEKAKKEDKERKEEKETKEEKEQENNSKDKPLPES